MILEIISLLCLLAVIGMSIYLVVTYIQMQEDMKRLYGEATTTTATATTSSNAKTAPAATSTSTTKNTTNNTQQVEK